MTVRELCEYIADEGRHIFIEVGGAMRTKKSAIKKSRLTQFFKCENEILSVLKFKRRERKNYATKTGGCIEAGVGVRMAGNLPDIFN